MTKKGIILVIIGVIFLTNSILMVVHNNYQNKKAATKSKIVYEKIQNKEIITEESITSNKDMKVVNIDGLDYIGTIRIPVLNLNLPVISEWDYKKMKTFPCRYYGSIHTNDLVICAHSYDNLFGKIKNLNTDDILIFTDISKKEYIYKVELIEILSPSNVIEMIESEFDLTLYTCTIDGKNRVTVRLNRI